MMLKWLGKDDSPLALYHPEIYPQGSFNIGTVIKPITHEDEYDIDLVCQLDISRDMVSQHLLKKMDILPAIPDDYNWPMQLGVPYDFARHAICITDKEKWHIDPDWPRSYPKGYAGWFRQRMIVIYDVQKRSLAERMKASIDEVPDYQVKTPLQRAIQILKRHRDIMFMDDSEHIPISIIITTLAAQA